jgi:pyrroline-5-carboxylate reductase
MAAPPLQPVPTTPAAANGDAFRLGFIGAGNLAESIARGVAASGVLPASAIRTAPHRRPERGAAFASIGACLLDTNAQVSHRLNPWSTPSLLIALTYFL